MALRASAPRLVPFLVTAACVSLPAATAQLPPFMFGSEEEPELWGDDTVTYDPAYPFGRDHDYIAINRSWFAADAAETHLETRLRVVSTERLEANRQNGNIGCTLTADMHDPSGSNAKPGTIHWAVDSNPRTGGVVGSAYLRFENGEAVEVQEIDSTFELVTGTPGYYAWTVSRATVMRFTWYLTELRASCSEDALFVTPFFNRDEATSKSNFSVVENRRVAAPDGALDPIERFERENATAAPSSTALEDEGRGTPAPGWAALVIAALFGVFGWRRRQPPAPDCRSGSTGDPGL